MCVLVVSDGVRTEEQVWSRRATSLGGSLSSLRLIAFRLHKKGREPLDSRLLLFQADGYQTADSGEITSCGAGWEDGSSTEFQSVILRTNGREDYGATPHKVVIQERECATLVQLTPSGDWA